MKKITTYLSAFALLLTINGCQDEFLEVLPADNAVVDAFYRNEAEIKTVTASLYGRPWFSFNDKFSWAAGDGLAGDLYNDYQDEGQFFFFTFTDANSIVSGAWGSLYSVIARTNVIINDMPRIASSYGVNDEVINAGVAEAKFFRAFAYYFLTEYWGDVPVVTNPTQLISDDNLDLPKNTRESIYQFIVSDLEFAAEHLPGSDQPGRLTSWSAKGLLSKIYLTMGSNLSSGDAAAHFAKAMELADDVIMNSGAELMENYEDLFKVENENNAESLFALQWISGAWGTGNSRQAVFARSSLITGNSEAWGGGKSMTYDFVRALDANDGAEDSVFEDLRRPAIFMMNGDVYPNINSKEGGYEYHIVNTDDNGDQLEYKAPVCNNVRKYIVGTQDDIGAPVVNQATPLNQYMLRLADVYLIYAEAAIGTGSSTTDAKALQYYNAIRSRAGLDTRAVITYADILRERRVEFAAEGINWLDVKRLYYRDEAGALAYLNNQRRAHTVVLPDGSTADANDESAYIAEAPESPVVVSPEDMFLPVPVTELINNPNLGPDAEAVPFEIPQ
ncbi:RagB/SusD family nutrient uptake outer membrane protein [Marinoscillum furvescens]|uniref:SusD-like starch-binding protein associating with outer membrane n=1 Tax=Marinoscillum furvescens DSM 4134 TaxID=1122208 RepID=A0A3D9L2L6_MARFU|nr:RagB/SusD family nutrient uptake outer membrane protein [Marinoscillum furvescens]RED97929.1 SusD-like starch-binding protein associating with outer membrane [Marinoscillum furvescens DSM 4134]